MEERLAEMERRMGKWEVLRKRTQWRVNFWFTILTLVVIASPFLTIAPDEEAKPSQAQVAGFPRLRFGRLWRAVPRTRRPRPAAGSGWPSFPGSSRRPDRRPTGRAGCATPWAAIRWLVPVTPAMLAGRSRTRDRRRAWTDGPNRPAGCPWPAPWPSLPAAA